MAMTNPNETHGIDWAAIPPEIGEPPLNWPSIEALDLDRVALDYDDVLDTLSLYLYGRPLPALNVPLDAADSDIGYAEARVAIATNEVVAVDITGYRTIAIPLHPPWAGLLQQTGAARHAALHDLLATVAAMQVYDGQPS